jgi:colanic acid biosynthesis glycosyl transferase WcaI
LHLYPLQPVEHYQELLVDADVCLITQQAGSGAAFFPSKLLATLGFGRPVISVADEASELSRAVKTGSFGENIPPGDAKGLAEILRKLASNQPLLRQYGLAGRQYVAQFESGKVLGQFTSDLQRVAQQSKA